MSLLEEKAPPVGAEVTELEPVAELELWAELELARFEAFRKDPREPYILEFKIGEFGIQEAAKHEAYKSRLGIAEKHLSKLPRALVTVDFVTIYGLGEYHFDKLINAQYVGRNWGSLERVPTDLRKLV